LGALAAAKLASDPLTSASRQNPPVLMLLRITVFPAATTAVLLISQGLKARKSSGVEEPLPLATDAGVAAPSALR
jgi:hypothetical protein